MEPRYQRLVDRLDDRIVDRPGRVIVAFLVVTVVFAGGLAAVSTEAGNEAFAEDVPEQEALDAIDREFDPPFGPATGTTQLIQTGENVLSKPGLLRMLILRDRLESRPDLRIAGVTSAADAVATTLDPNATTTEARIRAVEDATPGEIRDAVRTAARENPSFAVLLSEDFDPEAGSASATIALVDHSIPADADDGESDPLTPIQERMRFVAGTVGGDVRVFGSGILAAEFESVIGDTLLVVVPAAVCFILLSLVLAYRDLVDLLLGVAALGMAVVWTFGFMGIAGIPFNQILIAVPPLLLAVGIDFGIHAINRYREERVVQRTTERASGERSDPLRSRVALRVTERRTASGASREVVRPDEGAAIGPAMRRTTDQLLVAFAIVTATSVIGFAANLTSALAPIRDFGVVASVGIVFTALVFGVFLPAAKVAADRLRARHPVPFTNQSPLGSEGSALGRVLSVGVVVARRGPVAFLLVALVASAGAGVYATGLDTTFSDEQFLPPEETPAYLAALPEPFRPTEYTVTRDINFLEGAFETGEEEQVLLYVEGPMERDDALEAAHRAGEDPPATFVRDGRRAADESVVDVIRFRAEADPAFADLVRRNDRNGNGIPDRDLGAVYDALLDSPARDATLDYLAEDRRSARVVYAVEGDADAAAVAADARAVADRHRFEATPTGSIVVFQAVADLILESALASLTVALGGTALLLVLAFWTLEGRPSLGLANVVPVVVTVAMLAATMRLVGLSLNAFTATVLAITIGLGIDYSVHVVHRFVDEFRADGDALAALDRTVVGTGGALAGSVLTTVLGVGVLVLSIFPAIGQFGLLTALSVVYSFLAALLVLPPTLVVWARLAGSRAAEAGTDA